MEPKDPHVKDSHVSITELKKCKKQSRNVNKSVTSTITSEHLSLEDDSLIEPWYGIEESRESSNQGAKDRANKTG